MKYYTFLIILASCGVYATIVALVIVFNKELHLSQGSEPDVMARVDRKCVIRYNTTHPLIKILW